MPRPALQKQAKQIRQSLVPAVLTVSRPKVGMLVIESLHDPLDILFLDRVEHDLQLTADKMTECKWLEPELVGQSEFVEWTPGWSFAACPFYWAATPI